MFVPSPLPPRAFSCTWSASRNARAVQRLEELADQRVLARQPGSDDSPLSLSRAEAKLRRAEVEQAREAAPELESARLDFGEVRQQPHLHLTSVADGLLDAREQGVVAQKRELFHPLVLPCRFSQSENVTPTTAP
jgi:hypothetical protein